MELEGYYHVHKGPALVSIQSYINPVDTLSSCFLQMYFNIILQSMLTSSKWSFTHCVPTKVSCVCLSSSCILHAPSISFCLIWSPKQYLVGSTKHILIIHFIMFLYYCLLIRSKYLSQHSFLNHLQSMLFT